MAEYNEQLIKFGWLEESEIADYIEQGSLGKYNICFTKDTKRIFLINGNLELIPLKTRVAIYSSEESALEQINADPSTYVGEIISIKKGDAFEAYIIEQFADGRKYLKPVYDEEDLDYDLLLNTPITNKKSSITERVVLTDLTDGIYKINYFTCPDGTNVDSVVGNLVIVNKEMNVTYIKRIAQNKIVDYEIKNGAVKTSNYATDKYIEDQGFATTDYVDAQFAAFELIIDQKIEDYVENHVTLLVKYLINEELENRYSTEDDIEDLFGL